MSVYFDSGCEECGRNAELYHNESLGCALCEECDMKQDKLDDLNAGLDTLVIDRQVAGLYVKVERTPGGVNILTCTVDDRSESTLVEDAFEAFNHPCLHLSAAQVAELGIK